MKTKIPKYKLKDIVVFLNIDTNDFYQCIIEGARLVGEYGSYEWIYYIHHYSDDKYVSGESRTYLLKEWVNEDNIEKAL